MKYQNNAFLNSTWENAKTELQSLHENEIKCSVVIDFAWYHKLFSSHQYNH